jgi:hypothetical protein
MSKMRASARNAARRDGLAVGLAGVYDPTLTRDLGRRPPRSGVLYRVWFAAWLSGYERFYRAEVERLLRDADEPTRAAVRAACADHNGDYRHHVLRRHEVTREWTPSGGFLLKPRVVQRLVDTVLPARAGGEAEDVLAEVCNAVDVMPPDRSWMRAAFAAYDRAAR